MGGYATFSLAGARFGATPFRLHYEQNRDVAVGDVSIDTSQGLGDAWSLRLEERLRMQWGLEAQDRGRDVLQRAAVTMERRVAGRRFEIAANHEVSRVDDGGTSAAFDYTLFGASLLFAHGSGARMTWRLGLARRLEGERYAGDETRLRVGAAVNRYDLPNWTYDTRVDVHRRDHDAGGVVEPSHVETEWDGRVSRRVTETAWFVARGEADWIVFDAPDETYADYVQTRAETGVRLESLTRPSIELYGGGEWLRPQQGGERAFDQSRFGVKADAFLGASLWFSVEGALGTRNYLGQGAGDGILTDVGTLDVNASDFVYTECSAIAGIERGKWVLDAFLQYTVEAHEDDADDVSFLIATLRSGFTFR